MKEEGGTDRIDDGVGEGLVDSDVVLPIRRLILPHRRVVESRPKDLLAKHVVYPSPTSATDLSIP